MSAVTERPARVKVIRERTADEPTATKSTATSRPAQGPNTPTKDCSVSAIKLAFGQIEALLRAAHMTDENHEWSGDSCRLLRIAHGLAAQAHLNPPVGNKIDEVAFDIAGLIRAARLVPGDSESPERKVLVDQAAAHLNWLTECTEDCCDPGVPRPAAPNAANTLAAVAPNAWEHVICDVICRHETAQALLEKFAEENRDQPGVMGVLALVQTLEASLAKIGESSPGLNDHLKGVFPGISEDYLIAADVARAVNAQCEESLMWAAIYLLDDCKAIVDAHVEALTAAHASAAGKAVSP